MRATKETGTPPKAKRWYTRPYVPAVVGGLILLGAILLAAIPPWRSNPNGQAPPPMSPWDRTLEQVDERIAHGQPREATVLIASYIQSHPDDAKARLKLADIYRLLGRTKQRQEEIDKALKIAPNDPHVLWQKGALVLQQGGDAGAYFRRAAEQPDAGAGIWGWYGLYLLQEQQGSSEAREYLERAVQAGASNGRVYAALGQILLSEGRFDPAGALLQRATELTPGDGRAWALLAEFQRGDGQADEAVRSLQRALKTVIGPDRGVILAELGQAYVGQKNWPAAGDMFAQAAAYPATAKEATLWAARCYYHAERYALAMKNIDQAEELSPSDEEVRNWKQKIEDARFGRPSAASPVSDAFKPSKSLLDVPTTQKSQE